MALQIAAVLGKRFPWKICRPEPIGPPRGLALARPAGSRRHESLLLWKLAVVYIERKQLADAKQQLDRALDLAHETGLGSLPIAHLNGLNTFARTAGSTGFVKK